jgi:hypothetical protein
MSMAKLYCSKKKMAMSAFRAIYAHAVPQATVFEVRKLASRN